MLIKVMFIIFTKIYILLVFSDQIRPPLLRRDHLSGSTLIRSVFKIQLPEERVLQA